jgi:hypothetical protein
MFAGQAGPDEDARFRGHRKDYRHAVQAREQPGYGKAFGELKKWAWKKTVRISDVP